MGVDLEKVYKELDYAILIADDQKFMIKNLERYFVKFFNVKSATDLEQAIAAVDTEKIAVVIADHQMLDGQGLSLLEYVRDNHDQVRRVVITADRHEQLVIDMMRDKLAHSFVYKPTVKPQLHHAVANQMDIFLSTITASSE